MILEQVHHPYWDWEEVAHNMWGGAGCKSDQLRDAIDFTGDHRLYGSFMMRVAREWPVSCENALTDPHMNHKAWIGHAACALAMRCPEDIVREAWRHLSNEQKFLANKEAGRAIASWKNDYIEDKGLRQDVVQAVLC